MSAPRSVWLSEDAIEARQDPNCDNSRRYHLIPADPDGPMPGETWMCDGGVPAEVVRPRSLRSDGEVESWWVKCGEIFAVSSHLTRIPEPPEHEEWCAKLPMSKRPCTCERRKGERRTKTAGSAWVFGGWLYKREGGGYWPDARYFDRRASDTEGGR